MNSSAKTVASGRRVRPYAQPSVPAKCRRLRRRCSLIRRGFNCGRSPGRKTAKARSRRFPKRCGWKGFQRPKRAGDNSRTATAVAENAISAPAIQKTTVNIFEIGTLGTRLFEHAYRLARGAGGVKRRLAQRHATRSNRAGSTRHLSIRQAQIRK